MNCEIKIQERKINTFYNSNILRTFILAIKNYIYTKWKNNLTYDHNAQMRKHAFIKQRSVKKFTGHISLKAFTIFDVYRMYVYMLLKKGQRLANQSHSNNKYKALHQMSKMNSFFYV